MKEVVRRLSPPWFVIPSLLLLITACTGSTEVKKQTINDFPPALQPASSLHNDQKGTNGSSNEILGTFKERSAETQITVADAENQYPPTATPQASSNIPNLPDSSGIPEYVQDAGNPGGSLPQSAIAQQTPNTGINNLAAMPGQSPLSEEECTAEIKKYRELQNSDRVLTVYEAPLLASCYLAEDDQLGAIAVYLSALESNLDRPSEVELRQSLALLYEETGDYLAAIDQYDAIMAIAQTDITQAKTIFQAGKAELLAGLDETGYDRFLSLIRDYPSYNESYLALDALIEAGYQVDTFEKGLVYFHANVYEAAIDSFNQYLDVTNEPRPDVFLYLAWSHEGVGRIDEGLVKLDDYIKAIETRTPVDQEQVAEGWIQRAKMQAKAGRLQDAYFDFQAYLTRLPQGTQAAYAAWSSASLSEEMGNYESAIALYSAMAERYPDHPDAAESLFRAGLLSWQLGELEKADELWQRAVNSYPQREYGAAALVWLLKNNSGASGDPYRAIALNVTGQSYYALRARHIALGVDPFNPSGNVNLAYGDAGREHAESWLREWLNLNPSMKVGEISGALAQDVRLLGAQKYWQLGMRTDAIREFERLRIAYARDPLSSYQLALYFRDIGLYRLSIFAAISVMQLAGVGASDAPRFIARLVYPVYYSDRVLEEAQSYGYDPLLLFSLLREESFFDNFATSTAGARGISQILPDTGTYVARQLNLPSYIDTDLYTPEVGIAFGAFLLDQQLYGYNDQIGPALSSYNAGPLHANRWYKAESKDFDIFLENVDFPETQRYIKQLYIVHSIYRLLYS